MRPCLSKNINGAKLPCLPGLFIDKENATGCSVVLVHKDGEKSICAKLRASKIIPFNSVNMELVAESRMLFMEGYWLDNNLLTVKKIINAARKNLIRIAFTLSDPQIVVQQFDFFAKYMKHIDILLGNEKEFEALGESVLPPVAVKTLGANGVDVLSQGKWQHFQPLKVENVVNTTGAGDAFAGGFLYADKRFWISAQSVPHCPGHSSASPQSLRPDNTPDRQAAEQIRHHYPLF